MIESRTRMREGHRKPSQELKTERNRVARQILPSLYGMFREGVINSFVPPDGVETPYKNIIIKSEENKSYIVFIICEQTGKKSLRISDFKTLGTERILIFHEMTFRKFLKARIGEYEKRSTTSYTSKHLEKEQIEYLQEIAQAKIDKKATLKLSNEDFAIRMDA